MYAIELDIAGDCTLGQLSDDLAKFKLSIIGYIPHGPGGGNPCITFSAASRDDIRAFLTTYSPGDEEFYMERIRAL